MEQNNFAFGEFSGRIYFGLKYGQVYVTYVNTKVNSELNRYVFTNSWNVGIVLNLQDMFKKKIKNDD